MPRDQPPEPWHAFFLDIDKAFDRPIALQCIGGFAAAMLYGLPRPTVDVDFLCVVPADETGRLDALAGRGSALHRKHGHDLALSKLERNASRDREDVKFLARAVPLNLTTLEGRYRSELRPYLSSAERHDLTMRLWIEMLQPR